MTALSLQVIAHWAAVGGYALSTLLVGVALCFGRSRVLTLAIGLLAAGATAHSVALGLRWLETGHAPYLGRYEGFSSHAFSLVVLFLALQTRLAALRPGLAVVAPAAFLLLGVAVLSPASPTYPSPAMRSPWLTIHVSFAKLALATAVIMGAVGCLFSTSAGAPALLRYGPLARLQLGAPTGALDLFAWRLLVFTFFQMSVVILSGALWANAAWGSYWRWDPVETWSLLFWIGCALVLHLRTAAGSWAGPRWGRAVVALAVLGVVSFIGYGHFGISLHAYTAP